VLDRRLTVRAGEGACPGRIATATSKTPSAVANDDFFAETTD